MNNILTFESRNKNNYLYNREKNLLIYIHPLIDYFYLNKIKKLEPLLKDKSILSIYGALVLKKQFRLFEFLTSNNLINNDNITINGSKIDSKTIEYNITNIRQIVFEITDQCNLDCFYCCYGKLYNDHGERKIGSMPFKYIENTFKYLEKKGSFKTKILKEVRVGFYGGEPLLEFSIIKKTIKYIKENYKAIESQVKFTYGLTTNGTLLNKYIIDYFYQNDFDLTISLDGNKFHNTYRVFKNGENCFDVVYANIVYLKNKYPEYYKKRVRFCVVSHNENSNTDELIKFFSNLKKDPGVISLSKNDINVDNIDAFNKIQPKDSSKILSPSYFKPLYMDHNSSHLYSDYQDLKNARDFQKQHHSQTGTCSPFSRKIYIKNNGYIYPCERIGDSYYIGCVDNEKVDIDLTHISKKYNKYLESYMPLCSKCYNNLSCQHCIFNSVLNIEKEVSNCSDFVNYEQFKNYLVDLVTDFEDFDKKESYNNFMNHTIII